MKPSRWNVPDMETPNNRDLLRRIRFLKSRYPSWGYRKIWFHFKFVAFLNVNQKRILHLMKRIRK